MKALVTGGAGFLGKKLCIALRSEGILVRVLVRKAPNMPEEGLEYVVGDLADEASLKKACEGVDYVFHTAGLISYNPLKNDLMYRTNVLGTKNVAAAALHCGVKRFIHTSSTAAIGVNVDPTIQLEETSHFNARKLRLAYFDTKYDAEQELLKIVDQGLDAVILNPGSLVGPGDTRRYEQSYPGLIYKFKPPVLFHGGINFVDVNDVVAGHLLALKRGKKGERYILGGENLSFADFIRRTNVIIGRKSPKYFVPQGMMGFLAGLIAVMEKFGVHLHMTPSLVRQVTSWYLFVDSAKAKRELGYSPKPIDQAIRDTLSWLKELQKI
jgi:dihydroflavonol-4-reductase